jgi:hypothetical protein
MGEDGMNELLTEIRDLLRRHVELAEKTQGQDASVERMTAQLCAHISGQFGRGVAAREFKPGTGVEVAY